MIEKKRNGTKGNEQNEDPSNDKGKNPHNVDFRHGHVFEYQMVQYHRYNERDAANKDVLKAENTSPSAIAFSGWSSG